VSVICGVHRGGEPRGEVRKMAGAERRMMHRVCHFITIILCDVCVFATWRMQSCYLLK